MNIAQYKENFNKIIDFFVQDLKSLRTGRANASIVENIMVDVYGAMTPVKHLANIAIPDAKTIMINPWDKSILKELEKAIINSSTGYNPVNDGSSVRINIPALTEETRKDLIKVLNQKSEQARINIRGQRDNVKEEVLSAEKNKEITEDDRYSLLEELDELTKGYNKEIEEIVKNKEEEIMTI